MPSSSCKKTSKWSCGAVSSSHRKGRAEMRLAANVGVANHTVAARAPRLGLQEGDHREDAPMRVGGDRETQLLEDARDVLLDAAFREENAGSNGRVRQAFRHQLEHLALPWRQLVDRIVATTPTDELRHNTGIECRAAAGDTLDGGHEVGEVVDPVFQQIADAF